MDTKEDKNTLQVFTADFSTSLELPLYSSRVSAGFPSPADDYIDRKLDLNTYLIRHPSATYYLRASGDSMIGAGVNDGDLLIVDRSLEAVHGKIVIAAVEGQLTIKRLHRKDDEVMLLAENDKYPPIVFEGERDMYIWGVVTHVIRKVG